MKLILTLFFSLLLSGASAQFNMDMTLIKGSHSILKYSQTKKGIRLEDRSFLTIEKGAVLEIGGPVIMFGRSNIFIKKGGILICHSYVHILQESTICVNGTLKIEGHTKLDGTSFLIGEGRIWMANDDCHFFTGFGKCYHDAH